MNKTPIISFRDVNKSFAVRETAHRDLKTFLIRCLHGKFGSSNTRTLTVLENVSFDIYPGEFVGIMGRNGVGKSTILKLMSGIYPVSSGQVTVNGMIAPLLALGAGFSPELSGYDNIFLNAAILKFGRKRINELLDDIIDFSELRDKIHLPVKRFSSGMLVRLGFSVAVHLDAPILLLDEILAVGDAGFHEKCLKKVLSLHAEGRTIVLVTHDPEAVKKYCTRCIVLENRGKTYDGPVQRGADTYQKIFEPQL